MGLANVADKNTNAKLRVTFYWPFYENYWIIALGDNYEYAVVSEPKRQYLWILSREPTLNPSRYKQLTKALRNQGFDVSFLALTPQRSDGLPPILHGILHPHQSTHQYSGRGDGVSNLKLSIKTMSYGLGSGPFVFLAASPIHPPFRILLP